MRMHRNVPLAVVRLRRFCPGCPLEIQTLSCPFKIDRGKKIRILDAARGSGGRRGCRAQMLRYGKRQRGISSAAPSLPFVDLFRLPMRPSGISSPCCLDGNMTRRNQLLNGRRRDEDCVQKLLPLCANFEFMRANVCASLHPTRFKQIPKALAAYPCRFSAEGLFLLKYSLYKNIFLNQVEMFKHD